MMQQWFKEAKLGIFMHWGIYAVKGVSESWSFYNGTISYDDYMKQCEGFTAKNYNPKAWAELFRKAGAKYAVLTTKHHDGVALWDTKLSDLNVVKKTSAARDLIGPYCKAMREEDIRVGLYFSHLDWSHPDNASIQHPDPKVFNLPYNKFTHPDGEDDYEAWERFLKFHRGQLKELMTSYGKIDLLWFDGDWEKDANQWKMAELREFLHSFNSEVILNSRMHGYGDYKTPEQGIPIVRPEGVWEFCVTMNNSWGYKPEDNNYKSVRQIIRMFAECIGMGGNLLLDITPMEDGTIPTEQVSRLLELGEWIRKNEEAIYTTEAGLPPEHFYGASTLSKDNKTLYLFFFDRPWDAIAVKGIYNDVKKVSILGTGKELPHRKIGGAPWANIPGVLWIDIEEEDIDPNTTVIKLEMDEPIQLFRGEGHAIQNNL